MAEPNEIMQILKVLVGYYGRDLSEHDIYLYIEALQDIPEKQLAQAALRHIQESAFFPRISELRLQASKGTTESDRKDSNQFYWQAMEALNATFRGEMADFELERRYGIFLRKAFGSEIWRQEHLASIGLERVDECEDCGGCGVDPGDPTRLKDCPGCGGMGYFRIPMCTKS